MCRTSATLPLIGSLCIVLLVMEPSDQVSVGFFVCFLCSAGGSILAESSYVLFHFSLPFHVESLGAEDEKKKKKTPPDTDASRCERRQKYHQSNQAEKDKE